MSLKARSSFKIEHDAAGNRIHRKTIVFNPVIIRAGEAAEKTRDKQGLYTFEILPNPTVGVLYIDIDDAFYKLEDKQVGLYDTQGLEVYKSEIRDQGMPVDISSHPAGIYIMRITAQGYESSWKIMKL